MLEQTVKAYHNMKISLKQCTHLFKHAVLCHYNPACSKVAHDLISNNEEFIKGTLIYIYCYPNFSILYCYLSLLCIELFYFLNNAEGIPVFILTRYNSYSVIQ